LVSELGNSAGGEIFLAKKFQGPPGPAEVLVVFWCLCGLSLHICDAVKQLPYAGHSGSGWSRCIKFYGFFFGFNKGAAVFSDKP
jgi:hypothetical protein